MTTTAGRRGFAPALVYAALTSSIISSLGMLLVPSIAASFDIPVSQAQWMLTINLLVGAVATPVMGRLADGRRPKLLLMIALGVIAVGSAIATFATSWALFLVGRALQGVLYGIVPVTIALARRHLSYERSQPVISTLSVTVSIGIGAGYPLTGVLAELLHYRSAFAFGTIFTVTVAAVVWWFAPEAPRPVGEAPPFDWRGAILLGLGLGGLLLVIAEGATWGWAAPWTLAVGALTALAFAAWVRSALRAPVPLVNLRVLRTPEVLLANCAAIGLGVALYIGMSVSSLVAQAPVETGYGLAIPLLWAGFVIAPLSVGSFSANRVVRVLSRRTDIGAFLPVGALLMTLSSVMLWLAHDHVVTLVVGMLLFGVGIGTGYAAMPALINRSVAMEELGSAVSFNQVLRSVGGAAGAAVSGAALAAHPMLGRFSTDEGITGSYFAGVVCCVAVMTVLLAGFAWRRFARPGS